MSKGKLRLYTFAVDVEGEYVPLHSFVASTDREAVSVCDNMISSTFYGYMMNVDKAKRFQVQEPDVPRILLSDSLRIYSYDLSKGLEDLVCHVLEYKIPEEYVINIESDSVLEEGGDLLV